jgi:hypothetical protein
LKPPYRLKKEQIGASNKHQSATGLALRSVVRQRPVSHSPMSHYRRFS